MGVHCRRAGKWDHQVTDSLCTEDCSVPRPAQEESGQHSSHRYEEEVELDYYDVFVLQTNASKKKKKNKNKHPAAQNQENSNSGQTTVVPEANDLAPDLSLMCNGSIASTSSLVNGCHVSDPNVAIAKEQQHSRVPEPPPQKNKAQPTRPKEGNGCFSFLIGCCFFTFSV